MQFLDQRVRRARAHRPGAGGAARGVAALARRDCGHGRDPEQPHRRRRADVAWPARRRGSMRGARSSPTREHTAAAPLFPETTVRADGARRSAARRRPDSGRRRIRRRHARTASPRRSAAAGRTTRRRSSARAWAQARSRSGPTSTACSPPIRASCTIRYVVPHLSFAEASELAYFGAKVLHPATIQPAVARNIPVRILNSHRPHARGTLITARASAVEPAADRHRLEERGQHRQHHVDADADGARLPAPAVRGVRAVEDAGRRDHHVGGHASRSRSTIAAGCRRSSRRCRSLRTWTPSTTWPSCASSAKGCRSDPRLIGQVLQGVGDVPIRLVSQAASRRNVTFVIREADLPHALEPAARAVLRAGTGACGAGMMRLLLVGHGRMGKLVESACPRVSAPIIAGVVSGAEARSGAPRGQLRQGGRRHRLHGRRRGAAQSAASGRARNQRRDRHDRMGRARARAARARRASRRSACWRRRTFRSG